MVSEKRIDMKKLEALLDLGGIKKDVTLLALSGAAVICSLCGVRLGGLLEELTVAKARAGIEKLLHLTPQTARVVLGGEEKIIPAEEVQAGEILRVLPGESIPVDGVIISGQTSINQAVMTGESLPERETFQMVPGQGVCAVVGGHTVLAGRQRRFPSPDAGSRAGDFDGQHGDVCCCRRAARFLRWARFFAGP